MPVDEKLEKQDMPYVVFAVGENQYAVSSDYVLHIELLEKVTPIVGAEPNCMGVVLFEGGNVPVYDLRMMFGAPNFAEELSGLMAARIHDHENWVATLERSVEEGTEFTLTTDPHQCAFGKWFDNFETDNAYLEVFLKNVDGPHKAIHATGEMVKNLMAEGKTEEARAVIEQMKETDFAATKDILSQASEVYRDGLREILLILQVGTRKLGVAVDRISYIRTLDNLCKTPADIQGANQYVECIAKTDDGRGGEDVVLIMKMDEFKAMEAIG